MGVDHQYSHTPRQSVSHSQAVCISFPDSRYLIPEHTLTGSRPCFGPFIFYIIILPPPLPPFPSPPFPSPSPSLPLPSPPLPLPSPPLPSPPLPSPPLPSPPLPSPPLPSPPLPSPPLLTHRIYSPGLCTLWHGGGANLPG